MVLFCNFKELRLEEGYKSVVGRIDQVFYKLGDCCMEFEVIEKMVRFLELVEVEVQGSFILLMGNMVNILYIVFEGVLVIQKV